MPLVLCGCCLIAQFCFIPRKVEQEMLNMALRVWMKKGDSSSNFNRLFIINPHSGNTYLIQNIDTFVVKFF